MKLFTPEELSWALEAAKKCADKYRVVAEKHQGSIPYTTDATGCYDNRADGAAHWGRDNGLNWWTNGFWGGILWQLYEATQEERFLEIAKKSGPLLDPCFEGFLGLHHDVGFMWLPTAVADYRITKDSDARRRGLHAANLLAGRFNLAGGFIRAWNDLENEDTKGWAIIDCMMNIPLLYWASEETGDPRFLQIAKAHADTVMRTFIREDGSSHHIVEFDPHTGDVVTPHRGQGYALGSAWTRGQAWALYGFAVSYQCTGEERYLQTACRVADYFVAHIPESGLIPIDFDQPQKPDLEDSCGAAVAACGLLAVGKELGEGAGKVYREAALGILKALDEKRCDYTTQCDAILTHCSGAYHTKDSHHITMVYADYYYIHALHAILGETPAFFW